MQPALLQIQNDVTARLAVELMDWGITVRSQRKMIVTNEVDEAQLVLTSTNGKSGAGVLVQMPTFENERPNVPGPIGYIQMKLTCKEVPELNMNASTGTLKSAEEIAGRVLQLLHLWAVTGIGTFFGGTIVKSPAEDGVVAYDASVRLNYVYDTLSKVAVPVISGTAPAITIAGTGSIYYTVDGESFPGLDQANSFLYAAPFAATSGDLIRAAAYASGSCGSNIAEFTVP